MFKEYQLTEEEWARVRELSEQAHRTPMMALSVADGIAGRDFNSLARENVYAYWRELGHKYGFAAGDVRPVDEDQRRIRARFVKDPDSTAVPAG